MDRFYDNNEEFPQRTIQHITETASYKIFSKNIPNYFIIREVTERDYGIDCYIELTNERNQLTGNMVSIQLKGIASGINWNQSDYYTFSGINKSTTNYWKNFIIPVFLCLVDIHNEKVFYIPVKSYIRKNYLDYSNGTTFSYRFYKTNELNISNLNTFLNEYFEERELKKFDKEVITFISTYPQLKEFIAMNSYRDVFLGIEDERIVFLKHFYNNIKYLYTFFNLDWGIDSIESYQIQSISTFGNDSSLHEKELTEIVEKLDSKLNPLVLRLISLFWNEEKDFWIMNNIELFNIITNANPDGSIDTDWNQ